MSRDLSRFLVYPIEERPLRWQEWLMIKVNSGAGYCPVCGRITLFWRVSRENLRESCFCIWCRENNRKRQLAYIVCKRISELKKRKISSMRDVASLDNISIYNTETRGDIHEILSTSKNYRCSEYFGTGYKSGDIVGGIEHQDLMALSFPDNSFDLVLSADIFEHISNPYSAYKEVYRVLKPGGRHIFSIPFYQTQYLDEDRCIIEDGKEVHVKELVYHEDPLKNEGVLVYKIFSLEMLCKLKHIGFSTKMYCLYKPCYGIIGNNGLIFEAIKE